MIDSISRLLHLLGAVPEEASRINELTSTLGLEPSSVASVNHLREEMLQARQQREAARIIVEAATSINAAVDVDETLELVCRRSKLLLGSDMSYISLNLSPEQETYIRTTDGVLTPEYRSLRMPLGTGILGQAAGGSTIAQTESYLDDDSFPHIEAVDEAVRLEGVTSILAVTMSVRGERLGALLVAERYGRRYTSREVDLLSQIAGLAAVALKRAELIDELRARLVERDDARAEAETRNAFLARIEGFDQRLFDLLKQEASPGELAHAVSEEIETEVRYLHRSELSGYPTRGTVTCTAVAGDRILGALEAQGELGHEQRLLLERGAPVLTAMILFEERGAAASAEEQQSLVLRLGQGAGRDWKQIAGQLQRYWLREGAKIDVLAVGCGNVHAARTELRDLIARRGGITGESDGLLVIIGSNLPGEEVERFLAATGTRSRVAEVETVLTALSVQQALQQTQRTVRAMQALDITGVADPRWDLGLAGLTLAHLPASTAAELIRHTLAPLIEYDDTHNTSLLNTAWEYLEFDGNVEAAARTLHIHPNTLRQRVRRIGELITPEWATGRLRTDLHVALRLWKVREHELSRHND
ncbi:helix-turn-helix domain-containing protein [Microbacterium sp. A84]|uniref:helix-turn-helix domain-containing protein n=1 Tax=Microbacterium sp. A84 TaxID=3450715 RepID=UPI003F420188